MQPDQFEEEDLEEEEKIGTHSTRKYSTTFACTVGCTRDEVNIRGRWRSGGTQVVDTYISTNLPYPDAKVSKSLCIGGHIKYQLKDGCEFPDDWILQYVVPNLATKFGKKLSLVFGVALLWACFDAEYSLKIPLSLVASVKSQYKHVNKLKDNENPVNRILS